MVKGKLMRVSGPLVIAEGMEGSMVYEVVLVGEERLIGEVIGLQGGRAFIQVYEDTSGLRVGEPVEGTGSLLSAELGPGIVGKVYDGLQRPLSMIGEVSGAFIGRGVKLPALPRDAKWFFRRSERRVGDKVQEGDILGYVQETPILQHKIMVPPGFSGTLKELAQDGDYTVSDVIALLDTGGGELMEVKLMSKWPIRKPRPYRHRLEPVEPLITGTRVLDMMFPVAKGGKAAVPGGFGSGKCVLPGTPVLLADWSVRPIDELYREAGGRRLRLSEYEEVIELDKPLYVVGFDGVGLKTVRATHMYRGFTDSIVELRTASGRVLRVTPEHRLPVFDSRSAVKYVRARDVSLGTFLIVPRQIPSANGRREIPVEKLAQHPGIFSRDREYNDKVREFLKGLSREELERLSRESGVSMNTLRDLVKGRGKSVPLTLASSLRKGVTDLRLPKVLGVRGSRVAVRVPEGIDEELAELLGLMISSGLIIGDKVVFVNDSRELRTRFNELLYRVFGVKGREKPFSTAHGVEVRSSLLVKLFEVLGVHEHRESREASVPEVIMKADKDVAAAFIRGLYLGCGRLSRDVLEFSSTSPKLVHGLAYLMTKLGVGYSVGVDDEGRYCKLSVAGLSELRKLFNVVLSGVSDDLRSPGDVKSLLTYVGSKDGGSASGETIYMAPESLEFMYEALSEGGFKAGDVRAGNQVCEVWRAGYGQVLGHADVAAGGLGDGRALAPLDMLKGATSVFEHVALDEVEDVKAVKYEGEVYDLVVEDVHNFVGGYVPVIYHNTVLLHTLTKWSRTQVNIFVGCGERGNEMADALYSFRRLTDPASGRPLSEKAVFIANTSNMPVAARETSVFLGVTMGEYFRDMGYDVLMVADSTSRWAEAMREISARLEEMPGDEGFPAYLGSRLAEFYERAGRVVTLGSPERTGSLTLLGAVSPPGADFSEPVTTNTLRYIGALLALDVSLANRRHFPAISWLLSYSQYVETVATWWRRDFSEWLKLRNEALRILQRESELMELVRLVGPEALPDPDKLLLDVAKMIREDFLQQSAYHSVDAYSSPEKTVLMLDVIIKFYEEAARALSEGVPLSKVREAPVITRIARMKEVRNEEFRGAYEGLVKEVESYFERVRGG